MRKTSSCCPRAGGTRNSAFWNNGESSISFSNAALVPASPAITTVLRVTSNAATHAGSFSSLALPPLGAGLAWDTNGFAANGTLAVISTAPMVFNSVVPLNDGNFRLTFSGPTSAAYELRASTNLSLAPVTLWDLLDSSTFGNASVSFDDLSATNFPQRFYIIRLP